MLVKKIISVSFVFIIILSLFTACGQKEDYASYPFVNVSWTRDGDGDVEFISFHEDGTFGYYCACGNPVNDSDLCEGYSYDPESKTVTLDYSEVTADAVTTLVVKKCTEDELVLSFEGEIRHFFREGTL